MQVWIRRGVFVVYAAGRFVVVMHCYVPLCSTEERSGSNLFNKHLGVFHAYSHIGL